jgi:hypothetical protein
MKIKLLTLILMLGLILAACVPAVTNAPAPAVVMETVPTVGIMPTVPAATEAPTLEPTAVGVSFSKDIWPVLEKFALSAHGGKGGIYLESYSDVMAYVVPGSPDESMLYNSLIGAKGVPLMPPGNPLPPATIQLFYDWIKQGAKNN